LTRRKEKGCRGIQYFAGGVFVGGIVEEDRVKDKKVTARLLFGRLYFRTMDECADFPDKRCRSDERLYTTAQNKAKTICTAKR
jgi:hypothetical protein